MNKVHRIIRDEARGRIVVTHEKASSRGKPASTRGAAVRGVTAAVMALGGGQASASIPACVPSYYTLGAGYVHPTTCVVDAGETLVVSGGTPGASIAPASGVAVLVNTGVVAGAITNAGTITSVSDVGVSIAGTLGHITNSGTIAGGIDVSGGTITGGIVNSGTITAGIGGVIAFGSGTIAGGITNSGLIAGSNGILSTGGGTIQGGITNSGTIVADYAGIFVGLNASVSGGISNTGSLTGGAYGIFTVNGSSVTGGISNAGTLTANAGLVVQIGGTVDSFTNSGFITSLATGTGVSVAGAVGTLFNAGTIAGTVSGTNSGTVSGMRISGTSGSIINTGSIAGMVGASATGTASGIDVAGTVVGNIDNSGTITAHSGASTNGGAYGILVSPGGTITGGISNSGLISVSGVDGRRVGIGVDSGATIVGGIHNAGTIQADSAAVGVTAGGTIAGGITNTGTMFGMMAGIGAPGGTITGGITNSGVLVGYISGVIGLMSSVSGDITNSGTVGGLYGGLLFAASTISGGITNSGTILSLGSGAGILMLVGNSVSGDISNTGSIGGGGGGGILSGESTISGRIHNAGTIDGYIGISVSGGTIAGGITNAGTISTTASGTFAGVAIGIDATAVVPVIHNLAGGLIDGQLDVQSATNVTNAGTIALAATAGSTIAGNYIQQPTGMLRTHVADDTHYGRLSVAGTVTLPSNAMIDVNVTNPGHAFTVSGLPDVIAAGNLVSDGTFAVTDNSTLFDFSAVKDGNTVDLVMTPAGPSGVYESVVENQNTPGVGAAHALDQSISTNPGGPLALLFAGFTTRQQVSNAVTQTLPLLTGGSIQAGGAVLASINQTIQSRIGNIQGMPSGDMFLGDRNFWLKPFGSWAEQGDRSGVSGYDASVAGIATGFDAAPREGLRLGGAFAYANAGVDGKSVIAPQRMDTDVYQFVGYGSLGLDDRTDLAFQIDVGRNRNRGSRTITFAPAVARSEFDSLSFHAGVGLSRSYPLSADTRLVPALRLDYTTVKDEAYTETGAGALNLNVDGRRVDQLIAGIDGRVVHTFGERTTLNANLGAGYDILANRNSITASFAGAPGAGFTTYGTDPAPFLVRGGVGLTYRTAGGMEVTARYDAERRQDFVNQTVSTKLRWLF